MALRSDTMKESGSMFTRNYLAKDNVVNPILCTSTIYIIGIVNLVYLSISLF